METTDNLRELGYPKIVLIRPNPCSNSLHGPQYMILKYLRKGYIPWAFWPAFIIALTLGIAFWLMSSAEVGALAFTAVFIAWYSIETSKLVKETKVANEHSLTMRKEMTMANQLSIQPGLILEYQRENGNGGQWLFKLKNVGKGSAINIYVQITSDHPEYNFELNGLNALKDGDQSLISLHKNGQDLTTEEWQGLTSKPILATIYFERTKKLDWSLRTEVEIKEPRKTKVVETNWVPD